MTNVEVLGQVLMSKLTYFFRHFLKSVFCSEFHICSIGETSANFGTRVGDSGALVFLEENGRYCSVINCYHYYFSRNCMKISPRGDDLL